MEIIVFEGLDCSYKETNSKRLVEYLKSKSIPVIYESFPRYSNQSSYPIRRYLNNEYTNITLESVFSYYMIDQSDWWNDISNRTDITSDTIIVLDRFYTSNCYYLNKNYINKISVIEDSNEVDKLLSSIYYQKLDRMRKVFSLPLVDKVIKMYSDSSKLKEKALKRSGGKLDIYESDEAYSGTVSDVFHRCNFRPFLNITDNDESTVLEVYTENRSRDDIFGDILQKLKL